MVSTLLWFMVFVNSVQRLYGKMYSFFCSVWCMVFHRKKCSKVTGYGLHDVFCRLSVVYGVSVVRGKYCSDVIGYNAQPNLLGPLPLGSDHFSKIPNFCERSYFSVSDTGILGKIKIRVFPTGVEPMTFRLLVRMLYH